MLSTTRKLQPPLPNDSPLGNVIPGRDDWGAVLFHCLRNARATIDPPPMKQVLIATLCLSLTVPVALPQPPAPLRGYSADSSRAEREWETKFRAIPDPTAMRAYMQRLAARPHHVGSPYDKDNAEWILAKLKEFGLDAKIESFDVLFPTPKERALEMVEPTRFTAKTRGTHRRHGSHLGAARRAASHLQRLLHRWRRHRAAGLRELWHPRRLRCARAHGHFRQRRHRHRPLRRNPGAASSPKSPPSTARWAA